MRFTFNAIDATITPWANHFAAKAQPFYEWYYATERPKLGACEAAIKQHMPELVPVWRQLCNAISWPGSPIAPGHWTERMLSLWCPPAFITGCSQIVLDQPEPMLVRNYDHAIAKCEATVMRTNWLRQVIASIDCLWGALDGINDAGLAVSLAFGGRPETGEGFAIPLILRYVLETCTSLGDAVAVLSRVPCSGSYSVSVIDASGDYQIAFLNPDRPAHFTTKRSVTNHQRRVEWPEHDEMTASTKRLHALMQLGSRAWMDSSPARIVGGFLSPPLRARYHETGIATLYTAAYFPERRAAEYHWPTASWSLSFERFGEQSITLDL